MAGNTYIRGAEATGRRAVVSCWMCGIRFDPSQMVADGTRACADIRWYCRDARSCTKRWTSSGSRTSSTRESAESVTITSSAQTAKPAVPGASAPQSREDDER